MFEGDDDDLKRQMKDMESGHKRGLDPHKLKQLKAQLERKQSQQKVHEQRQEAIKGQVAKQQQLKEEMSKQGIVQADQKMQTENMIKDRERQEDAQRQVGGTEQQGEESA